MNVIVEAVAVDRGMASSPNLGGRMDPGRSYFEQACVSLASARRENPDCDTLIVANCAMPEDIAIVAESNGIGFLGVPFDEFCPSERVSWQLAFYKLRALAAVHALGTYEHICLMDTDTWCQAPLTELLRFSGGGASW